MQKGGLESIEWAVGVISVGVEKEQKVTECA